MKMPKRWANKVNASHKVKADLNVDVGVIDPTRSLNQGITPPTCPVTEQPMRIVSQRIMRDGKELFIPVAVSEDARIVLPLPNEHMEQLHGHDTNSSSGYHVPVVPQTTNNQPNTGFKPIAWD